MFARIRWHLVGWNILVVALILGVLGSTLYVGASRNLRDQLDRDLASRADQAAANFGAVDNPNAGDIGREGFQGGVFYLLVAADGRVLVNPQNVDLTALRLPASIRTPGTYATVAMGDEQARLFSAAARPPGRGPGGRPEPSNPPSKPEARGGGAPGKPGPPFTQADLQGAVVVAGTSLAPVEQANRFFVLYLVVGGGLGLVLSFAGAWFLADRSMVPIERAFRRQQEFVADASHELRTPLTILRSTMDLLHQELGPAGGDSRALVDEARVEIDRLQRLTADLLTLARSDRGQLVLALAPLNARVMAAEAVRRLAPLAQERGVEVRVESPEPAPTVEADPDRLRQVLLILLDNALKHTPAGGRVTVAVRPEGRHVAVEVADTGSGIAPEHLPRLFERFYRADAARTRAEGGSGLGLAIAKALVDAHGGELALASAPGQGTRVTVRLPAEAPDATAGPRGWLGGLVARLSHPRAR